ncbi:MAG: hypothetical protein DRN18_00825 [Thermoplasmata archaeon]|nr:MAG: hypothetical protein DRN18_00825 [Thermoplasmata archaeon]
MEKDLMSRIKKDFDFLRDKREVKAILLYGSYARNEQNIRSDIDICVVAPKLKTPKEFASLLGEIWRNVDANKYDVRIFEELPLYLKMEVIKNHEIIFSVNPYELSYYFYHYRKIWNDQSVNWFEKK